MLKKIGFLLSAAAGLAVVGYASMAFAVVVKAEPGTVLTLAASDRIPFLARSFAQMRVQSWDECPTVNRGVSTIGQTLRGYGLDGFENQRVLETASLLLAHGCSVNERSIAGQTPIHEAILYNEPEVVRFLLANGADPRVTISIPGDPSLTSLRHYHGMDAVKFAQELSSRGGKIEGRAEIVEMLTRQQTKT